MYYFNVQRAGQCDSHVKHLRGINRLEQCFYARQAVGNGYKL